MAKLESNNEELGKIATEYQLFAQLYPHVAYKMGLQNFFTHNKIALTLLQEKRDELKQKYLVLDENNQPKMEKVQSKIIDIGGKPKEDNTYDFVYKTANGQKDFEKENMQLLAQKVTIEI